MQTDTLKKDVARNSGDNPNYEMNMMERTRYIRQIKKKKNEAEEVKEGGKKKRKRRRTEKWREINRK